VTDFLDEIIAERTARNPDFPALLAAAADRRRLLRELAQTRVAVGLTQTEVAARMGTAQSAVARLESGASDAKLSTLERYAAALGAQLNWTIRTPASGSNRRKAKASSTVRT
jgi:transcriptional regulator with XRE-family HTH domain